MPGPCCRKCDAFYRGGFVVVTVTEGMDFACGVRVLLS